jgi:hypothetical protein
MMHCTVQYCTTRYNAPGPRTRDVAASLRQEQQRSDGATRRATGNWQINRERHPTNTAPVWEQRRARETGSTSTRDEKP